MNLPIDQVAQEVIEHCFPWKYQVKLVTAELCDSASSEYSGWIHMAFKDAEQLDNIEILADRLREVTKCIYGKPAHIKGYVGLDDI